jgi:hypothetical protein
MFFQVLDCLAAVQKEAYHQIACSYCGRQPTHQLLLAAWIQQDTVDGGWL